jgi:DNA ligase D-like protein (predicted ligase)
LHSDERWVPSWHAIAPAQGRNVSGAIEEILSAEVAAALRPAGPLGWRAPMLATLTDRRFSSPDWVFERKLDGVRAIVSADGRSRPRLWSRNHNDVSASYPELVDSLERAAPSKFVSDGEIVAFDGAQTSFTRLQGRIHVTKPADIERAGVPVFLYLFDLLALGQVDLTGLPLRDRKRMLRAVIDYSDGADVDSDQAGRLRFSVHRNDDGESFYAYACAHGWEGLIAKRADSVYRSGRSSDWLKFKCVRDQEFVVGGFTEPAGSRTGLGALLVGYYDRAGTGDRSSASSPLRYAGKVGTGFDRRTLTQLRARLDRMEQPDSPFADRVREPAAHWVTPELVVQVGFSEWTRDGRLRHPRYTGIRTDKPAGQVVRE